MSGPAEAQQHLAGWPCRAGGAEFRGPTGMRCRNQLDTGKRQETRSESGQEGSAPFVVQSLSHVGLFATPWVAARQASLSFTTSWSLLKLMSIESVMPSNHLILCRPLQSFPASESFVAMSRLFASGGQSIGELVRDANIQVLNQTY